MNPPLIVHVVHRLDFGGLENGLINLINGMDAAFADHAIISLTEVSSIRERLPQHVEVIELRKSPGKDFSAYRRLYDHLVRLQPQILHTRNLGTLDCQIVGKLARVPHAIHSEHGWDVGDPDGASRKNRFVRRALNGLVDGWIALSLELAEYLVNKVGIPASKVTRICNGVNLNRFDRRRPAAEGTQLCFGSVTRFTEIKDPANTIEAFAALAERAGNRDSLRFLMVGDGPLLEPCRALANARGIGDMTTFAGAQLDVKGYLQQMDVFVLGSQREGISNTILEAKACGIPVVATDVGGNGELVAHGTDGFLAPPRDPQALADSCERYLNNHALLIDHACASRTSAETRFSLETMIDNYQGAYARWVR